MAPLCYGFCSLRREGLPALALTSHGFEIEIDHRVLHQWQPLIGDTHRTGTPRAVRGDGNRS